MNKMHPTPRLLATSVSALALWFCLAGSVLAEDKTWEVKPGDTLGAIISKEYPGYTTNRAAIMQAVIKASPDAFIDSNLNRMRIGKTLNLPKPDSIPGLQPPPPPSTSATDPAIQARLKALETERAEMAETLKLLEDENAELQGLIADYETAKKTKDAEINKLETRIKELEAASTGKTAPDKAPPDKTATEPASAATGEPAASPATADIAALQKQIVDLQGENTEIQTQLETAKMDLADSQGLADEFKAQLDELKSKNEALSNDLQQARAATAVAESNAAGSNRLPWILLGIMALLMLPLLWLLRRNQNEPSITTIPAAPKSATDIQPLVPAVETVTTPISRSKPAHEQIPEPEKIEPDVPDVDLKLDIARAYLDLRNPEAAADILKDVLGEGGTRQKQEAREILSFIS